jgi:signal peptidase I
MQIEYIRLRLTIHQATHSKHTGPNLRIPEFWYLWLERVVVLIALYTLINLATVRFVVEGLSMQPYFESGQFLIISRAHYNLGEPQRGDIIVFHLPLNKERDFIKRIIGLPSEAIEIRDTQIYVDGKLLIEPYLNEPCIAENCSDGFWQLAAGQYFVMGDNRNYSSDSRTFGAISREFIVGNVMIRYWPVSDLTWIHQIGLGDD